MSCRRMKVVPHFCCSPTSLPPRPRRSSVEKTIAEFARTVAEACHEKKRLRLMEPCDCATASRGGTVRILAGPVSAWVVLMHKIIFRVSDVVAGEGASL